MIDTPAPGTVRLLIEGPVAHITFDRPHARNAMTWHMYEELGRICAAINADPASRCAVLRGAGGKAFVAGTDIEQFKSFTGEDGVAYEKKVDAFVCSLEDLSVPTIAIVEGWAVGGGLAFANACDFRFCTPGTRFGVPIARTLGNCLSARNIKRLISKLGTNVVQRMLLLADMPTVEELPEHYAVISPVETIDRQVEELCERISGLAPLTLRTSKSIITNLGREAGVSDDDLIRQVYGSNDFREGVAAFLGKRAPVWTGG